MYAFIRRLIIILILIATIIFGSYIIGGHKLTLIAKEEVILVSNLAEAVASRPKRIIATIAPGDEVSIISCKDVKHYIVPKVRLGDGTQGYVANGDFAIKREYIMFSFSKTFGC